MKREVKLDLTFLQAKQINDAIQRDESVNAFVREVWDHAFGTTYDLSPRQRRNAQKGKARL